MIHAIYSGTDWLTVQLFGPDMQTAYSFLVSTACVFKLASIAR